jgi:hypothetical protein
MGTLALKCTVAVAPAPAPNCCAGKLSTSYRIFDHILGLSVVPYFPDAYCRTVGLSIALSIDRTSDIHAALWLGTGRTAGYDLSRQDRAHRSMQSPPPRPPDARRPAEPCLIAALCTRYLQ